MNKSCCKMGVVLTDQIRRQSVRQAVWEGEAVVMDPELVSEKMVGAVVTKAWLGREPGGRRCLGMELEREGRSGLLHRFWVVTPVDDPDRLRASAALVARRQMPGQ